MNTSLAEVRSRFDPSREQKFLAKIQSLGMAEKWINFTSPYVTGAGGGLMGHVPEVGTMVIVTQPALCGEWFYVASTFKKNPILDGDDLELAAKVVPVSMRVGDGPGGMAGAGTGNNDQVVLSNPAEHKLVLSQERRPPSDSGAGAVNYKTELRSGYGKEVSLIDSPGLDCIKIDTGVQEGKSFIWLGGEDPQNPAVPANSVKVYTTGPQDYVNVESQTTLVVKDGKELQLLNNSTGSKKEKGSPQDDYYGNINIQSDRRDINIFSRGDAGRIFIECLNSNGNNQVIQIETNGVGGAIRIITQGKVDISAGDIGIDTSGSINIKAGGDFNVDAGGQMNFRAGGNINSDGAQIHLNSAKSSPATPNIGTSQSYYGDTGITTY